MIKNEIPILEYDNSSPEVIAPDLDWTYGRLPEKCLFAFLGDVVHEYAAEHNAGVAETLITVSHDIKVYVLHEAEEDICLVQPPIGAAAAAQVLDTLVTCGCRKVIAAGSCGVLADLEENAFIVPTKALRAEGTSYHYLPPSRYIDLDEEPLSVIQETLKKHGLPFVTCAAWSTDGFFRETRDMVRYRLEEGCSVVEMECAALAACCRLRGAKFGQLLFTADSLANVHEYDAREFGKGSHEKALLLGLEILRNYK
ncbi:MAG: nucleoside phosphorylase [Anaerolineaceae bacterium]|nr:nucleoside phosphorylase [Anaerolineaceae bacterium]